MHGSVLARAVEASRDPVVLRKPSSGLLGTAVQASGKVSGDAVTGRNRVDTVCQLESLGAATASRAGQDHLPTSADVPASSRRLDIGGGSLHDLPIAGTDCTGSKRRRRSPPSDRQRRTTDPFPAIPACGRGGSTYGLVLSGSSSKQPGISRGAARRPRKPAPAYRILELQPPAVPAQTGGPGDLLQAVEVDLGELGVADGRCVPVVRGAACLAASCRDLMVTEFSEGAVDQAMQAAGSRIWMWVSRTSRFATISTGQPACAMLWRRMPSGAAGPDRSGGAEIMLLATGAGWVNRGLAACVVRHLRALVNGLAPGHPCAAYSAPAALPFWVQSGFTPVAQARPPGPSPPHQRPAPAALEPLGASWCRARGMMPWHGTSDACYMVARGCAAACPGAPGGAAPGCAAAARAQHGAAAALLSLSGCDGVQSPTAR
jgi:hypothetical protein